MKDQKNGGYHDGLNDHPCREDTARTANELVAYYCSESASLAHVYLLAPSVLTRNTVRNTTTVSN